MNLYEAAEAASQEIKRKLIEIRESVRAPKYLEPIDFDIDENEEGLLSEHFDDIQPNQPLIKDDKFHMVYIKDHQNNQRNQRNQHNNYSKDAHDAEVEGRPSNCFVSGKKVHFYYCCTLVDMTERGRRSRYRVTQRTDNIRIIDLPDAQNIRTRLAWCINCIKVLCKTEEYGNYDNLRRIAEYGNTKELMNCVEMCHNKDPSSTEAMEEFIRGLRNDYETTSNPENWTEITNAYRRDRNYTCEAESCRVNCSTHPEVTDTHHRDGDRANFNYENLECLCKYHHAKKDFHEHYEIEDKHLQILLKLWKEQDLPIPHDLRG